MVEATTFLTVDNIVKTVILGIVQGLTEWLPVSSTGHLRLFETFLGLKAPVLFDGILHAGTLIVILVFFRREVTEILSSIAHLDFRSESGKMVPLIIIGVTPTALIGLVFGWLIADVFQVVPMIGVAFLCCGMLLYSSRFRKEKIDYINYFTSLMMGLAQGIAIVPGISRSGATIAVALLLGIKREKAFIFSFLLSVPAVVGALAYTLYMEFNKLALAGLKFGEIFLGVFAAMLVGYLALRFLWRTLASGRFHLFAFYCWLLGSVLVLSGIL